MEVPRTLCHWSEGSKRFASAQTGTLRKNDAEARPLPLGAGANDWERFAKTRVVSGEGTSVWRSSCDGQEGQPRPSVGSPRPDGARDVTHSSRIGRSGRIDGAARVRSSRRSAGGKNAAALSKR